MHGQIALKLIAYGLRVELPDVKDARDLRLLLMATSSGPSGRNDCYDHGHLTPARLDFDHDLLGPYLAGARILRDFGPRIARRAQVVAQDPRLPGHAGGGVSARFTLDMRAVFTALADGLGDADLAADPDLGDPAAG